MSCIYQYDGKLFRNKEALINYLKGPREGVEYNLKAVNAIIDGQSVFEKGKKNGWSLDKILTELQIPKEQKEIIKDLGLTDPGEILATLLAEYTQPVEINISKTNDEAFSQSNTQYYSNLTASGGTNYTENEIATPAITPNIKGHATFSTDSGIGWFRSDEKQNYTEQDIDSLIDNMIKSGILQKNCS